MLSDEELKKHGIERIKKSIFGHRYRLTKPMQCELYMVDPSVAFPGFTIFDGDKEVVHCTPGQIKITMDSDYNFISASETNTVMTVEAGYEWDGCSYVGVITETIPTLIASLSHDILHVVKKFDGTPDRIRDAFTWADVDFTFMSQMDALYEGKSVRPFIYYWGLRLFGWPWHHNKVKGTNLRIV